MPTEIDDLPNHLPSIFCKILHVQFFKSITILGLFLVIKLILEWNKTVNMDEDHNQEAGFVTEEVNQVVKVIIQTISSTSN